LRRAARYNTPAYALMKPVLEAATKETLDGITQGWLARPAAMFDTAWRKRPAQLADVGNPTGLVTTPGDIARMGRPPPPTWSPQSARWTACSSLLPAANPS